MKTKIFYTSLFAGIFLSCGAFAQTHASGGVSGGTAGHSAPLAPRTGINPVVRPNGTAGTVGTVETGTSTGTTTTTTPNANGVQNVNGAQNANIQNGVNSQLDPGMTANGTFTSTSNTVAGTNGPVGTNNLAGTNGVRIPNNVTARVNPMTNFPVTVNSNFNGNIVIQDQAVTAGDRVLLTTLSQGVRASLGIAPNGNTPVHFLIQNGTVTIVGTVQSTAQSDAVFAQVQQTPGVLSVINDTHVSGPFAPAIQNGANRGTLLGAPTDRAFSVADQTLLTTVQQEAALQLGVTSLGQMPVHFSIQNGVVGVTGRVSSFQEKQALIAALARTQGIVRVVDNVAVVPGAGVGVSGVTSGHVGVSGTLTPTSRDTNTVIGTNVSGF